MRKLISNYGWMIVVSFIIAVITVLATPFGMFISDGFINITKYAGDNTEREVIQGYEEQKQKYEEQFGVMEYVYKEAGMFKTGTEFVVMIYDWEGLQKTNNVVVRKNESNFSVISTNYNKDNDGKNPSGKNLVGDLVIRGGIQIIDDYGFAKCDKLTSVALKDINLIKTNAFLDCTSLTDVYIENDESLEYIDENAFKGCTALTKIHFNGTRAQFNKIVFKSQGISKTVTVMCTDGNTSISFS